MFNILKFFDGKDFVILEVKNKDRLFEGRLEIAISNNSKNNVVIIHSPLHPTSKVKIVFNGSNSQVELGSNCNYRGAIRIDNNASVVIGDDLKSTNNISILCRNNKKVSVGKDCLFASNIVVRTSDEHSIIDLDTKEVINNNKDVVIRDRVWIGDDVKILKGSNIDSDTVVGTGSIVSGKYPGNTIIAGIPAKIIRENICWKLEKPE